MFSETLGKWHFWLTVVSFNLTFMPQFSWSLAGMPRRIPDYALQFVEFNAISTVGAFILGFSQLIFAYNVWKCVKGGTKATDSSVWGTEGLEGNLSSPRRTIPGKCAAGNPNDRDETERGPGNSLHRDFLRPRNLVARRATSRGLAWVLGLTAAGHLSCRLLVLQALRRWNRYPGTSSAVWCHMSQQPQPGA